MEKIHKHTPTSVKEDLHILEGLSRLSYKSIYIVDCQNKMFEYVSDNPLFLCGYSSQEVIEQGYDFYLNNVKKQDLELLTKIYKEVFSFYQNIPMEEREEYTLSCDFHLMSKQGEFLLVHHKLTPIDFALNGEISKIICTVELSTNTIEGNVVISKQNSNEVWKLDLDTNFWKKENKVQFSKREIQILILSAKGLSIDDIANQIFLSSATIKYYRKKISEKIGFQSVVKALSYIKSNKIISFFISSPFLEYV